MNFFNEQIFTKAKEKKCFKIQIKSYVDFTTSHLPFNEFTKYSFLYWFLNIFLYAKPYSQTSMKMKSI